MSDFLSQSMVLTQGLSLRLWMLIIFFSIFYSHFDFHVFKASSFQFLLVLEYNCSLKFDFRLVTVFFFFFFVITLFNFSCVLLPWCFQVVLGLPSVCVPLCLLVNVLHFLGFSSFCAFSSCAFIPEQKGQFYIHLVCLWVLHSPHHQ